MHFANDCSVVTLPNDLGSIPCRSSKTVTNSRFSIGFEALDRYMFKPENCYDLVAETGVKWARCMTGWRRCEPEKGVYDFAWLDDVVDNLLSRGVQPWFNVSYGNKLYMEDIPHEAAVGCVPLYYGEEANQAWCDYITALTQHFQGRVNHFEIWNESNGDAFWLPKGASGKDYTELVALTSTHIRQVNQNAQVTACLFGVDIPFIRDCLKSGMGEHIQFFALHPYGTIPEIGYANEVKIIRRLLSEYAPQVKLWQGECGCPSQTLGHHDSWLGLYNMDETKQAKWVARRLLTDISLDFDLISYFHATDLMENDYVQANGQVRPPVMMGLLNGKSYTPKIAYHTFCGICTLFDEDTQIATLYARPFFNDVGRCKSQLPKVALQVHTFIRNGYPLFAYWLPEDVQQETEAYYDFSLNFFDETENRITEPMIIDLVQNKVFAAPAIKEYGEVRDTQRIPLTDYPILITDRKALNL